MHAHRHACSGADTPGERWLWTLGRKAGVEVGAGCSSPAGRGSPSPRCDTPPPGGPWDTWERSSRSQCHGTASQRSPPPSPSLQPHHSPLRACPTQPTLPSAAQHSPPALPKPPPGKNASSPCVPRRIHPDSTAISSVRHLLLLFSPTSQPFPCLKLFCAFPRLPSR